MVVCWKAMMIIFFGVGSVQLNETVVLKKAVCSLCCNYIIYVSNLMLLFDGEL